MHHGIKNAEEKQTYQPETYKQERKNVTHYCNYFPKLCETYKKSTGLHS
jgi:hypothetical protein